MRFAIACEVLAMLFAAAAVATADVFEFRLSKQNEKWTCTALQFGARPGNLRVNVLIPPTTAENDVAIKATVTPAAGAVASGELKKSASPDGNLWTFEPAGVTTAAKAALAGQVEKQDVACEQAAAGTKPEGTTEKPPQTGRTDLVRYSAFDLAAAAWLDGRVAHAALADIRAAVARENPHVRAADIILLPHLPSGGKAPSYPASISERQIAQTVIVVPKGESGSIEWALTRCEDIPSTRVHGDFAAFQEKVPEPDFGVVRIGTVLSCGADRLEYTLRRGTDGEPVATSLTVRPVYHVAAAAFFGFDRTKHSTFEVRDGRISETVDYVGSGLLVGGTYFVNGLDFADVRWYQHFLNPFAAIAMAAPTERFVVGTTVTRNGGISAAIGIALNHVPALKDPFATGQAFTGTGDVPQRRRWTRGFYIGIAVDDKLYAALKKLKKTGSGGGTGTPPADAAKPEPAPAGGAKPPADPKKPPSDR